MSLYKSNGPPPVAIPITANIGNIGLEIAIKITFAA